MFTDKAVAIAVLAALSAQQVAALNAHRHIHKQVQNRGLDVDWVTVWETVYVTAGEEPEATEDVVANDHPDVTPVDAPHAPAPTPTITTSTSTVVVAPTLTVQEAQAPPPAPVPTTMATAVKPPPAQEPVPEPSPEPKPKPDEPKPDTKKPSPPKETSSSKPPSDSAPVSKRGIAYNDADMANLFDSACESCGWAYNWGSSRQGLDASIEFIPTLWGDLSMHTDHWDADAADCISSGSKAIFSFNEPDHATQSNMSPQAAAAAHAKYMNKYSGQALVGAPSVTNSGNPGEGLEWLQSFLEACDAQDGGCAVDFCNVHWYSESQYSDTLFEHLEKANSICGGKPVWLTEFAPLDTDPAAIAEFVSNIIPQLDAVPYLDAYSYFMVSDGVLMSGATSLSDAGNLYATV